jgi:hypothetical protein
LTTLTAPVEKYLRTRAIEGPWNISGSVRTGFYGAVVIPALAECDNLFGTLTSLAANPPEFLERFLVLVVVNNREETSQADKNDNRRTLSQLAVYSQKAPDLNLAWLDAASPGREMPRKGGGVGMARKLGLDLALSRLDFNGDNPVLVCLDADTLVEPTYLPAITAHFRHTKSGGAIIPFLHRPAPDSEGQAAIDRYELFLRSYVLGLSLAHSPYAFHTVGSAMACSAEAYIRMGGMNRREAAEDFYFLQQLHRSSGVSQVTGTTVYPSPRPSHRVPFGTGRSVSRSLDGDRKAIMFYQPRCFAILGEWLELVTANPFSDAASRLEDARSIEPLLAEYLELAGFPSAWDGLRKNNRNQEMMIRSFHCWFDALKTMKLIHHLSAARYPRCSPQEAVPPLLQISGFQKADDVPGQLALLRTLQNRVAKQSA